MKPMYTDPEELGATDGLPRGMPYLALSEDQIDELVAYLLERQ
jgi:cytochrome c oxidase subunit 2